MWRCPHLTKAQQLNKLNDVIGQQLLNLSGPRFLNYKMRGLGYPISRLVPALTESLFGLWIQINDSLSKPPWEALLTQMDSWTWQVVTE